MDLQIDLPAGHNDAGLRDRGRRASKDVALVARSRPARIRLLDGSLYTWLGAKALSQFLLMGGNHRGILFVTGIPTFHLHSTQALEVLMRQAAKQSGIDPQAVGQEDVRTPDQKPPTYLNKALMERYRPLYLKEKPKFE